MTKDASHQSLRRPIHVHIPKTAGTSFRVALGITDPEHQTASELHALVGDAEWYGSFTFALVRNPFDRLVSIYTAGRGHRRPRTRARYESMSFDAWVREELCAEESPRITARRRYSEWIDEPVEYVGRFEEVGDAWARVAGAVGVELSELPQIHRTEHGHYRDLFDDATRRLVEDYFSEDLDLYEYAF